MFQKTTLQYLQTLETQMKTLERKNQKKIDRIDDTEPTSSEHAHTLEDAKFSLGNIQIELYHAMDHITEAMRSAKKLL